MTDFTLYCLSRSGNAYKPALMLQLCQADWDAKHVDLPKGEHKSPEYLEKNVMGEVPILVDHTENDIVISQSGVILYHLAEKLGRFDPKTDEEKREVMRWILFDNHKLTGTVSAYRLLIKFMGKAGSPEAAYMKERMIAALNTLNTHLEGRDWVAADRPTIADISLCGYLFWPGDFDVTWDEYPGIAAWLERIVALPHYAKPEDIMPSEPTI